MKLIVAGATSLVGTEIIKQGLQSSEITSVIAPARRPVTVDDGIDSSKLKSVVIKDYGEYPDELKAKFAGADACIWTVAITPFRSGSFEFDETKRVCQTCYIAGLKAMYEAVPAQPFRVIYFSAEGTPRDLWKKPLFKPDYQLSACECPKILSAYLLICESCDLQGETERMVLEIPMKYKGFDVCIAQPGVVTNSSTWSRAALASMFGVTNVFTRAIPNVNVRQLSAAVLDQAVRGFEKETLRNNHLVRIGHAALKAA